MVKTWLYWLRIPTLLFSLAIITATLLGYVSLGRFLAGQVMLMGCGGTFLLLLHMAVRALTADPLDATAPVGRILEKQTYLTSDRRSQIASVLAFLLNALLAIAALLFLLLSWGFPLSELIDGAKALFFGFEIGQFRISLFRILLGIGLFAAMLLATQLIQRWLRSTIFSDRRIDAGIANSLHTVIGYVGMGIAAVVGLSYAGIDFTNLTVVIGALSLGVGLGLQSIVNNFVSGLILLVERPVKVGDWVIVGDREGYVRKISVRATEIETFDRASVIIPNAELIGGAVHNWTHRNAMGRVVVSVGVGYGSDPEKVHAVLMDVAKSTDGVLGFPEPFVSFDDFGASSLDFTVRCYVPDINKALSVKTALRLAIFERFRTEGIEIPFPQQDVHLRDLDIVKAALARVAAENASGNGDRQSASGGRSGQDVSSAGAGDVTSPEK